MLYNFPMLNLPSMFVATEILPFIDAHGQENLVAKTSYEVFEHFVEGVKDLAKKDLYAFMNACENV